MSITGRWAWRMAVERSTATALSEQLIDLPSVNHPLLLKPGGVKASTIKLDSPVISGYRAWSEPLADARWDFQWDFSVEWAKWLGHPGVINLELTLFLGKPEPGTFRTAPVVDFNLSKFLVNAVVTAAVLTETGAGWSAKLLAAGSYAFQGVAPAVHVGVNVLKCSKSDVKAQIYLDVKAAYAAPYMDVEERKSQVFGGETWELLG